MRVSGNSSEQNTENLTPIMGGEYYYSGTDDALL